MRLLPRTTLCNGIQSACAPINLISILRTNYPRINFCPKKGEIRDALGVRDRVVGVALLFRTDDVRRGREFVSEGLRRAKDILFLWVERARRQACGGGNSVGISGTVI